MGVKIRCCLCEAYLEKICIGMNKKILGRGINKFFCMECLGGHLDTTTEELLITIEDFKAQGCKLFD